MCNVFVFFYFIPSYKKKTVQISQKTKGEVKKYFIKPVSIPNEGGCKKRAKTSPKSPSKKKNEESTNNEKRMISDEMYI
jgi:uroporphyrinogen-III synthase